MIMRKHKKYILAGVFLTLVALSIWIFWGNTALEVNQYEISSNQLPAAFSGFRIMQISDLHNAEFGADNCKLLELVYQSAPDMIVLTGDLVDSRDTNIRIALEFAAKAVKMAPVFYVPGNYEARISQYEDLKTGLENAGVTVLENESVSITRAEARITLIGVTDPAFKTNDLFGDARQVMSSQLDAIQNSSAEYRILLSHRPELFESYASFGMDLVFSGHAHGGQIRLPIVGGLVAPNQGFFPEYDAGVFSEGNTNMVVSRGLGNSIFPLRLYNRPEIIVTILNHQA